MLTKLICIKARQKLLATLLFKKSCFNTKEASGMDQVSTRFLKEVTDDLAYHWPKS